MNLELYKELRKIFNEAGYDEQILIDLIKLLAGQLQHQISQKGA